MASENIPKPLRGTIAMVVLFLPFLLAAQPGRYTSTDKKAVKLYEDGAACMARRDAGCAESKLKQAASHDKGFVEPRLLLAELYDLQDRTEESIARYREVVAMRPGFHPNARLHLADLEFRTAQYDAARNSYMSFLNFKDAAPYLRERARLGLESCDFAVDAMKRPVPFEPLNLGQGVNTAAPEYYPCVTADGSTLMFTRLVKDDRSPMGMQEDFFLSDRGGDGAWGSARPIPSVNTERNEGAGTLSPDGRFIIFTACAFADGSYGNGREGLGSCDLFISRRVGDRWSPPENLGEPVNSRHWESQPSLAGDGRTLYFIRGIDRQDGRREQDIYMTRLGEDGRFSKPEKLGPSVNTPLIEESVQIHPDGRTLYFSSNGHPGFGGLDIYMSRRQKDGNWGPALNLGYPINTSADENSLVVSADGRLAFFASDRPGGQGDLDLYQFELYPEARPQPVTYIKGRITDATTGKGIEADVELHDLADGILAAAAYSDPRTGEFLVCLPAGRDYALTVATEGYLFHSENYSVAQRQELDPMGLDVALKPIKAGETITLRNIFFETASHELLPSSEPELVALLRMLNADPRMRIELRGHTDSVGRDKDNLLLSERRANAVRDHLLKEGIAPERVEAKGFGRTLPVASNDTEEGRALNRRTEVKVL